MYLSQYLPYFKEKTLLIVTGGRCADYYSAHGNVLNKIKTSCIEPSNYLDNEGQFFQSEGGCGFSTGSVLESHKREEIQKFIHQVSRELHEIHHNDPGYTSLILFAPRYLSRMLLNALRSEERNIVREKMYGNFIKTHPSLFLKRLRREFTRENSIQNARM